MSRFGWAYVSDLITGSAAAAGPTNSVQYNSGSGVFSGSNNFTFNPSTNTLTVVGTISASAYLGVSGSGGTTSPAGLDKYLQYNSGSAFGASSNLIFDYTTNELIVTGNVKVIGQVSSSTSLLTSGTITAGSNITSFGIISGSSFLSNGNITSNGVISSSGGLNTGGAIVASGSITSTSGEISASVGLKTAGTITAGSIISSSAEIQTNSSITASNNIISTAGFVSASNGLYSGNGLQVTGSSVLRSGLTVTGSSFVQALSSSGQIQATSFAGNGLNIIGVQATNVDGAGDDWTIQFKDGNTGRLTGSSGLTFSGSALTSSVGKFDTIILGRSSTSSSISLNSSQHIIAIDTFNALGSVTLSLPNASTLPSGKHYVIKDEGGNANNRNIILSCSVFGQSIDGSSILTITSPYAAVNVYCDGTSKYFIY